MKRIEAFVSAVIAFALIVSGLVWEFGYYGLVGPGAVLLLYLLFFADIKE